MNEQKKSVTSTQNPIFKKKRVKIEEQEFKF